MLNPSDWVNKNKRIQCNPFKNEVGFYVLTWKDLKV